MAKTAAKTGDLIPAGKTTAVTLSDKQARIDAFKSRLAANTGNRIKLEKGRFVLPDGSEGDALAVIILDFVNENSYYDRPFDKNSKEGSAPACFAIATEAKGIVPSGSSPAKQAETCGGCPHNQYGSAPNGGAGKACRNGIKLAVVRTDGEGEIMVLNLSPTGIKPFSGYIRQLGTAGLLPCDVVTNLGCRQEATWTTPVYERPDVIEDKDLRNKIEGRLAEAYDLLMEEPDVSLYKPPVAQGRRAAAARR